MQAVALVIVAIVGLSVVALLAMVRRKAWNADGSDDERRKKRLLKGATDRPTNRR